MFSRSLSFIGLLILSACATLPDLYKSIDDISTDDAITIKVDKDAFQKDTDVSVSVKIKNK